MTKHIVKITIDAGMFLLFLLLMGEHLLDGVMHEWLGMALFLLFFAHTALNFRWYRTLFKGKYAGIRMMQTGLNLLLLVMMLLCIISSLMLSGTVFAWMGLKNAMLGRQLHMLTTAWVFVLMSVHLGFHQAAFCGMAKKIPLPKTAAAVIKWTLRVLVAVATVYGIVVFVQRRFYEELFFTTMFKQFDYEKTVLAYLFESAAMSVSFVSLSYYLKKLYLKRKKQQEKK